MNIVIGVEQTEGCSTVASLVESLRFDGARVEVVHVVERLGQIGIYPKENAQSDLIARYLAQQEKEGEKLLVEAKTHLTNRGFDVKTSLLSGFAANTLIDHAGKSEATLLALGSSGKGPLEGVIVGSTGRKAVIHSPCSVLIAKKAVESGKKVKVVVATDLSSYAGKCIDAFLGFKPKGISEIILTTVIPKRNRLPAENPDSEAGRWLRGELASYLKELTAKLDVNNALIRPRIEVGAVSECLEKVMTEEKADLLVVGAQGHGFLERMSIGSVSLEQAIRKPYSVLVVRV